MSGTSAFSSEDDVTKKHIEAVSRAATDADELSEVYELDRCSKWIADCGFSKIALQFPDELLVDSVPVQSHLQKNVPTSTSIFILGDTSYGSCCVDEVAAEHYHADAIIHFGSSCLAPTQRVPVLYVFCCQSVNTVQAAGQIQTLCASSGHKMIVTADTMYHHAVEPLVNHLKTAGLEAVPSHLQLPSAENSASSDCKKEETSPSGSSSTIDSTNNTAQNDQEQEWCMHCKCNRQFSLPNGDQLEDYTVCYIGEEGKVLTNLMMTFNKCPFISYNPNTCTARRETLNVSRELMKRYYMIERAKEAKIVGILAGTLGVSKTRDIITQLQTLLKSAGKKSYTFVVGKLNVPKLANFMEVDVFVLVACPLNTLIDSKEFLKPVVTPFEMEVACNQAREWTGDYITDFLQLLPGAADHIAAVPPEPDAADVSLITNKLVSLGQRSQDDRDQASSSVMLRSDAMALTSVGAETAGEYLAARSWQGLDRQLGQTPVEKAKPGRSGIAMGYRNEPQ